MDWMMTVVAWGMITGMVIGAVGGWLIFVVAWFQDLHATGRLNVRLGRGPLGRLPWFRRNTRVENRLPNRRWNLSS